jgi:hypothetical protein
VVQDWNASTDTVLLTRFGFTLFADVQSHSYQNGVYFVVQVDGDSAAWLKGATVSTAGGSQLQRCELVVRHGEPQATFAGINSLAKP